jgi:predicted 3-demethylubiquinone-9 3-methyltransferase (glyoxalase superfamily)
LRYNRFCYLARKFAASQDNKQAKARALSLPRPQPPANACAWLKAAKESRMKKINAFLWFDSEAEEAAKFYVGIFKNSKINRITYYPKEAAEKIGRPPGSVMTVEFTLDRVDFVALNGGPQFKFTEAISLNVNCETQDEVDYFWENLSADGGSTGPCGWLKDKFGISWQVNPVILGDMLADRDAGKAERVMNAMMKMDKIEIAKLGAAYWSS